MAPRSRNRVGLTRMDAAIDHLSPMGFSPALIRRKVDNLLDVYGGHAGWAFIEEASYKLLIESILEDQEEKECELGEPSFEDLQNETRLQAVDTEPSGPEPLCLTDAALLSPKTVHELPALPTAQTQNSALHEDPTGIRVQNVQKLCAAVLHACDHSAPPGIEHTPQQKPSAISSPKRKPCLGWIGPKDDNDFVLLNPMPVKGTEAKRRRARKKLNSKWDEKPDDVPPCT